MTKKFAPCANFSGSMHSLTGAWNERILSRAEGSTLVVSALDCLAAGSAVQLDGGYAIFQDKSRAIQLFDRGRAGSDSISSHSMDMWTGHSKYL